MLSARHINRWLLFCAVLSIIVSVAVSVANKQSREELEQLQIDNAEAMIELERLEARIATYQDVIHDLRTGRID